MAYHDEPTREIPALVHRNPGPPPLEAVAWQPPRRWEEPRPNRPPWHERDIVLVPLGLLLFATMIAVVAGLAWAFWPDSSETATATDVQTLSPAESTPTVLATLETPDDEPARGSISSSGRPAAPIVAAPTITTALPPSPTTPPTTAAPTTAQTTTTPTTAVPTTPTIAVPTTTAVPTTPAPPTTPEPMTTTRQCDPNYSGCVPVASDVDCAGGEGDGPAYLSGTAEVIGTDIYGLDRDDNGVACD